MHTVGRNESTCRLGRRPVTQGPRPQLSSPGWVEKLATGEKNLAEQIIESG
jgi:hypothetical protein